MSAATVTRESRTLLTAVNAYGKPVCLRTNNGIEITNNEFQKLLSNNTIPPRVHVR